MEERKDYAVLRFVDQNGWSYMVNDYAKGCYLMEYIKQGIRVEKETVFEWNQTAFKTAGTVLSLWK